MIYNTSGQSTDEANLNTFSKLHTDAQLHTLMDNVSATTSDEDSPPLTIWIDGDAAPREVKELIFRVSTRLNLPVHLVANQSISVPTKSSLIKCIVVNELANAADRYIVEHAIFGDLVITADIPLAAALVDKGVCVIEPRGEILDDRNVHSRLASRNLLDEARGAGAEIRGPKPYDSRDKSAFAAAVDRTLHMLIRRWQKNAARESKAQVRH